MPWTTPAWRIMTRTMLRLILLMLLSAYAQCLQMHKDFESKSDMLLSHTAMLGKSIQEITDANDGNPGGNIIFSTEMQKDVTGKGYALIGAVEDALYYSQSIASNSMAPERCNEKITNIEKDIGEHSEMMSHFSDLNVTEEDQKAEAMMMVAMSVPMLVLWASNAQLNMVSTCAIQNQ